MREALADVAVGVDYAGAAGAATPSAPGVADAIRAGRPGRVAAPVEPQRRRRGFPCPIRSPERVDWRRPGAHVGRMRARLSAAAWRADGLGWPRCLTRMRARDSASERAGAYRSVAPSPADRRIVTRRGALGSRALASRRTRGRQIDEPVAPTPKPSSARAAVHWRAPDDRRGQCPSRISASPSSWPAGEISRWPSASSWHARCQRATCRELWQRSALATRGGGHPRAGGGGDRARARRGAARRGREPAATPRPSPWRNPEAARPGASVPDGAGDVRASPPTSSGARRRAPAHRASLSPLPARHQRSRWSTRRDAD